MTQEEKLFEAILNNNLKAVEQLIVEGVNLEDINENGHSALFIAVQHGNVEIVELLLEKGADIHQEPEGKTILMKAIGSRNAKEMIELLLKKGAPINTRTVLNESALSFAVQYGDVEIVELLLEKGADIHQSLEGITILMKAIGSRNAKEMIEFLLKKGADINAKGPFGESVLSAAVQYGDTKIVKLLLERGAEINHVEVLRGAAQYGHTEIMKLLLEKGANVNAVNLLGLTPLMLAAQYGHTEIVKLLLENGVNVKAPKFSEQTALMLAAQYRHTEIVKLLLENGANVCENNSRGQTALDLVFSPEIRELLEKAKVLTLIESQTKTPVAGELTDADRALISKYKDFAQDEVKSQSNLISRLFLHVLANSAGLGEALRLQDGKNAAVSEEVGNVKAESNLDLKSTYKRVSAVVLELLGSKICAIKNNQFKNKNIYKPIKKELYQISSNIERFQNSVTDESEIKAIITEVLQILGKKNLSLKEAQFALDFMNYDYPTTVENYLKDLDGTSLALKKLEIEGLEKAKELLTRTGFEEEAAKLQESLEAGKKIVENLEKGGIEEPAATHVAQLSSAASSSQGKGRL